MKKPLITVAVKKPYAGIVFVLFIVGSVCMLANVISSHSLTVANIFFSIAGLAGVGISCFGLFAILTGRYEYNPNARKGPFITVTEESIICKHSNGIEEKVLWEKINRIRVWTTDEGPYTCDVFFVLSDSDGNGVVIPQDKEESKQIFDRILKFPGFDHATFISAMSSAQNQFFDVWEKK